MKLWKEQNRTPWTALILRKLSEIRKKVVFSMEIGALMMSSMLMSKTLGSLLYRSWVFENFDFVGLLKIFLEDSFEGLWRQDRVPVVKYRAGITVIARSKTSIPVPTRSRRVGRPAKGSRLLDVPTVELWMEHEKTHRTYLSSFRERNYEFRDFVQFHGWIRCSRRFKWYTTLYTSGETAKNYEILKL